MSAVKSHLMRRISEVVKSPSFVRETLFKITPDNQISLTLPLADDRLSSDDISKAVQLKPDELLSAVTFSDADDSLIFTLNKEVFVSKTLIVDSPNQRANDDRVRKKFVVDFSSPNVAKPFHMGHLRSTIVGQFVANVLSRNHQIVRLNYLGDWGTQFGFVQKGLKTLNVSEKEFEENPIPVLYRAYVEAYSDENNIEEARDLFMKLEIEDSEYMEKWERIKGVTCEYLRKTYDNLGIRFDEYSCESDYRATCIPHVIKKLEDENISKIVNGQMVTTVGDKQVPLLRQNRTTLYLTRDIAAALDRIKKFACDKLVYVVDKSQSDHFKYLADILSRLGHDDITRCYFFGRITGMSTRKGTSVFLADILAESVSRMAEQQKLSKNTRAQDLETTKTLGLTGLQVYILKHARLRDFSFDWGQALQSTGDSGVKIQYTHSRLCSLEERFNFQPGSVDEIDEKSLNDPSVLPLVFQLARCDDVVSEATKKMESPLIVAHLFKLCNLTSRCLKSLPVKGQEESVACQRLHLFHTARMKIKELMEILGIKPLRRM
ncbi:arginyl-tRNA synthetase 2, mitochondrial [Nesidiocoris tenuis]|uniref:Probable arginine--tRNA ligase, mitochondrial n=1 Tax=Nesidiocoris tenuis TaxID=355587 RepID=A0ABN7AMN6_9HEMI|nr:arginyl-tRNA synthetase 2, mitochondrial [Nesidiocoris tenuis]